MVDQEFANRIRIRSIESVTVGHEASYKVTISFDPQYQSDVSLIYEVFIDRKDFDEQNLVAIARNYFHHMCKSAAESTENWALTDEQFDALKRGKKTS